MDTIVALATPPGNSGVAVIRISGENSKEILSKLIKSDKKLEPRKMYLKDVCAGDIIDRCLVVYFAAPFSYTGEDVVEIQSHGGFLLAQKIIETVISLGAKPAEAGEFSKRAFINGKLSLDKAEGIMDLINSESESQLKSGTNLLQGKLTELIEEKQLVLTNLLAEIEAKIDYPEYEFSLNETTNIETQLTNLSNELNGLIEDSKTGVYIKSGVRVALVGAPNVGKSSLLNALTNTNKAIVTDIAGTTRDIVEAEYEYKGINFHLFDTAGIHESEDVVEQIGIERAKKSIEEADIVLRVTDSQTECEVETDKPYIDVFNKTDLNKSIKQIKRANVIYISAKTGKNIEALKELIFINTVRHEISSNKFYLTNLRHIDCVKSALNSINKAIVLIKHSTLDIVSHEIKQSWSALGEITGQTNSEQIIDTIFSKFCLGK